MTLAMSLATWQGGEEGGEEEEKEEERQAYIKSRDPHLASGSKKQSAKNTKKHPTVRRSAGDSFKPPDLSPRFRWIILSSSHHWAIQTQQGQRAPDALQPELCPVLNIGTFLLDTCSAKYLRPLPRCL